MTINMADKKMRMARLFRQYSEKTCIVPIDHGVTIGPAKGLENYPNLIRGLVSSGVDAVVLHKGLLKQVANNPELARGRYILHLSASTMLSQDSSEKVLVASVEEAIQLGADGVSIHINLGAKTETTMLKDFGAVSRKCMEWGIPLMAMMYVANNVDYVGNLCHASRLAEELGADIIKIEYPGTVDNMKKILNGVQIPVIIAGGSKKDSPEKLLYMINDAMTAGVAGVAIGRNIFEYEDPELLSNIISRLVHGAIELEDCFVQLSDSKTKGNYWERLEVR